MTEEELDVTLKLFGVQERGFQRIEHFLLLQSQLIRVSRVESREIGVPQLPYLSFYFNGSRLKVHLVKEQSLFQLILRMSLDSLPLHLKLADGDGLVHFCSQLLIHRVVFIFV